MVLKRKFFCIKINEELLSTAHFTGNTEVTTAVSFVGATAKEEATKSAYLKCN